MEQDKKEIREMAKALRESADILDEVCETEDTEKQEELLARFMLKMMKLQQ